jgi:hypothetical protein
MLGDHAEEAGMRDQTRPQVCRDLDGRKIRREPMATGNRRKRLISDAATLGRVSRRRGTQLWLNLGLLGNVSRLRREPHQLTCGLHKLRVWLICLARARTPYRTRQRDKLASTTLLHPKCVAAHRVLTGSAHPQANLI